MKRIIVAMVFLSSLVSAASWYYDDDGCTKIYPIGYDASECFDKKREILQEAGCNAIYILSGGMRYCIGR